jgi:hypothetical protein
VFGWWRRKKSEPHPTVDTDGVEFLGPATVAIERRFPEALKRAFAEHPEVRRAFLARIRYVERNVEDTALCLGGTPSDPVLDEVQRIFWALFPKTAHLDVFFVTAEEEERLADVCEPFYDAGR